MKQFKQINAIYSSFLVAPFPARETVEASDLPMNVQVEIPVIAAL